MGNHVKWKGKYCQHCVYSVFMALHTGEAHVDSGHPQSHKAVCLTRNTRHDAYALVMSEDAHLSLLTHRNMHGTSRSKRREYVYSFVTVHRDRTKRLE